MLVTYAASDTLDVDAVNKSLSLLPVTLEPVHTRSVNSMMDLESPVVPS